MSAPQTLEDFTDPGFGIVAHMEANQARLVEQNRELLAALKGFVGTIEMLGPIQSGWFATDLKIARAAIAKAEGQP